MQRTILLADDSPTIRRLVTQTFSDGNFRIVEVNNGDAAIRTFDEVHPSVVLADIYMPGKNGYQVCAYIRSHRELSKTPVVLLVGAFEAFDEDTAKQAGATASITKPFEPTALVELVMSILPQDEEQEATAKPQMAEPAVSPTGGPSPAETATSREPEDLLGLESIFEQHEPLTAAASALTEEDIDRIADRVIQKLSSRAVESIAWDVVPDIAEKIVREELKRVK